MSPDTWKVPRRTLRTARRAPVGPGESWSSRPRWSLPPSAGLYVKPGCGFDVRGSVGERHASAAQGSSREQLDVEHVLPCS